MADNQRVTAAITAQNSFTDEIYVASGRDATITIEGTFTATVTVQYKLFQGSDWIDLETKTAEGRWDFAGGADYWRAGVKTGDYTTGTVNITMNGRGSD